MAAATTVATTTSGKKRMLDVLAPDGRLEVGLVLTHACNLACAYCYTGEKKRVRMTLEMALRALDLGFEAAREELQLTFFGGEPMLESELLLEIANAARARSSVGDRDAGAGERKTRVLLQATTNGTLLDDALIDRLHDAGVFLAISIDGTRVAHEALRPLAGGGSSYDATLAVIRRLVAKKIAFDVIAVLDPLNVAELAEGVRMLLDEGVESITLNMNWAGSPAKRWDDPSLAIFEAQMEEVAAVFVAWLRRGRYVRIRPLEGSIVSARSDSRSTRPAVTAACDAGTRRIAIAPSGRVYGCARAVGEDTGEGSIGHLDHGFSLVRPKNRVCQCAAKEETVDAETAGPVSLRHDAIVSDIGERVASLLGEEFERIEITESR